MNPKQDCLYHILPHQLRPFLSEATEEIRLRRNREILCYESNRELSTGMIADKELLEQFLDRITKSSVYVYFDNIREGFITIEGGHRIGLSGTAVYEDGKCKYLNDIASFNVRVAHEKKGVAQKLFSVLKVHPVIPDTLIISPPGCGKTTLLRDTVRMISDEIPGCRIAVIDERSELAAVHMGEAQNDLGKRTDILNGYTKKDGISHAIRSLSPTIIATDEIGSYEDEESLLAAKKAGITILATIHGDNSDAFGETIRRLQKEKLFQQFVYLTKKNPHDRIEKIISLTE